MSDRMYGKNSDWRSNSTQVVPPPAEAYMMLGADQAGGVPAWGDPPTIAQMQAFFGTAGGDMVNGKPAIIMRSSNAGRKEVEIIADLRVRGNATIIGAIGVNGTSADDWYIDNDDSVGIGGNVSLHYGTYVNHPYIRSLKTGAALDDGILYTNKGMQFAGNLTFTGVQTVDGVDISAHAADANAHHNRQHSIVSNLDHTSLATPTRMLKADANGLPVEATNTDAQVAAAVTASHVRLHPITAATDHSLVGVTSGRLAKFDAVSIFADSAYTDASIAALVAASHARQHNMTAAADHAAGNWKVFHSDGAAAVVELALGAAKTVLISNGAALAPSFGDHGGIDGLGDDDHPQYILANGTRAMSAAWNMGTFRVDFHQPYVHVRKAKLQTIGNSTDTAITFNDVATADVEESDALGFHSLSTNPTRFTVPANCGGLYLVMATVTWAGDPDGMRGLWIRKNGSAAGVDAGISRVTVTEDYAGMHTSAIISLAAADYVEMWVWHNAGANLDVWSLNEGWYRPTELRMIRISEALLS